MQPNEQNKIESLTFNKQINIATANTREAAKWANKTITIEDFVVKLATTVRTHETIDEYMAMPKSEQDAIKDVGGFVAGTLKGGRRDKESVANRSAMTLDADFADKHFLEAVSRELGDYNYSIYSTHKHSESRPRYRLVVVTDRPMLADEYQASMRKLAAMIGIDCFDDTTYDVNRLMYWPSSSSDAPFYFKHNDKDFISVDALLGSYGSDWRDASLWPVSSRESRDLTKRLKKLGDPREKKNLVGAVCRVYDIHRAIKEELSDVYRREKNDRYTFLEGSSTNGLVVYDDVHAYSNHDTDPAGKQTCNAFDLIRIHKFGHLDDDAKFGTPVSKLPSYSAMREWATESKEIRGELVALKINDDDVTDDFDEIETDEAQPVEQNWQASLQIAENGTIKPTFLNATIILKNDEKINAIPMFNKFSNRVEIGRSGKLWDAPHSYKVRKHIGRKYDVDFPESKIEQAIEDRAQDNAFHPVQEYLESIEWDGKPRLSGLFIDYFKCDDNAYTREAAKCCLVAAVNRVFEPGFKFDSVPVIGGAQGIGKSTFIETLARREWYGELTSFDPKIAVEETQGRLIVEINEMGATNRHDLEIQKAFISSRSTTVRLAYARHPAEYHRQFILMGTTNQTEYLKDSTGNRRWWPIESKLPYGESIDFGKLESEVDQIWAEAYMLYMIEDETTLLSKEAQEISNTAQEEKRESDTWQGVIEAWLEKPAKSGRYEGDSDYDNLDANGDEIRDRVCCIELWEDCLSMKGRELRRMDSNRITAIMNNLESWEKAKSTMQFGSRFGKQKGWFKVPF
jgi:putative DNA primase/helicase